MITVHEAERLDHGLRRQGRPWQPAEGDRFVIPGRDIDEVFVVAEMTIEVEELPTGRLVKFNGTTEWALDSIPAAEVLWIPWEHQLRDLLGDDLLRLERLSGEDGQPGNRTGAGKSRWAVELVDGSRYVDTDPEAAYAQAVLDRLPL